MASTTNAPQRASASSRERAIRIGLGALAAVNLFTGLFMVVDPSGFVDSIGPFGEVNDHYVRDVSTWSLAYGAALVIAAGNASWRVPVLGFGIAQAALHVINHVVDVGDADPGWVGVFDVVAIAVTVAVMWWLLSAVRAEGARSARR